MGGGGVLLALTWDLTQDFSFETLELLMTCKTITLSPLWQSLLGSYMVHNKWCWLSCAPSFFPISCILISIYFCGSCWQDTLVLFATSAECMSQQSHFPLQTGWSISSANSSIMPVHKSYLPCCCQLAALLTLLLHKIPTQISELMMRSKIQDV